MRVPTHWGVHPVEIDRDYPCDEVMSTPRAVWYRGVDIKADPSVVYRWLCQMRVAPYSYDLLDNLGRRSPRTLTPGAEELAVGQHIMTIFELVSFEPDRHLTIRMRPGRGYQLFGDFALTYDVREASPGTTRLVAKLLVGGSAGPLHEARRRALAWGDLLMMRKQLLTFRTLAERSAAAVG
ncbi:hypothetical protein [Actinokineospora inagensis]|uniref:hypothetical protein n=1 Tax=Actinokineospora inagensis TaxID=103730 RepID=UPI00047A6385|nr:hypothetical protein [Actinokineospora inagensis]